MITYTKVTANNKSNGVKEIIDREKGTVTYVISDLGKFIRKNKTLKKEGALAVYIEFCNINITRVNEQDKRNYLCPIVSVARVADCDTFNEEAGKRIAWAKLMKKVYIRLAKMNSFNYNYHVSKLNDSHYNIFYINQIDNWSDKAQRFDTIYNEQTESKD